MHPIYFYRDAQGRCPIADYIAELSHKNDKDSRITVHRPVSHISSISMGIFGNCAPFADAFSLLHGIRADSYCSIIL